jgi:hypothetical protein
MFRLFGRSSIAPRKTGSNGRQEEYESISKAFIEPNNTGERPETRSGETA